MLKIVSLTIPQRLQVIRIVITIALLISICLSFNLWGGYRYFPYTPVIKINFIKAPYDCLLILFSCFFLIASLFLKATRKFIFIALLLNVFMVLLDLNRLQPWFFYYNAVLFVFLFYDGRVDNSNNFTSVFIIIQLLIASIYIYNGLNKFNSDFVQNSFIELIEPLKTLFTERQFLFFIKFATSIPYLLLFIGLGLIIVPIRYLAITLGCLIHISLFILLFPSKTNQSYALWFMNNVFLIILFVLFSGKTKQRYFSPAILFQKPIFYFVIIVFFILPTFNLFNKGAINLLCTIKNGNEDNLTLSFTKIQYKQLPLYVKHFCAQLDTLYVLDYNEWCLSELKTDCNVEKKVFEAIYTEIAKPLPKFVKETQFIINTKQSVFTTK